MRSQSMGRGHLFVLPSETVAASSYARAAKPLCQDVA